VSYPISIKKIRILGKDATTVQASFTIYQRFSKALEAKFMKTVYSKLNKKYCFLPFVTAYFTPIKTTKVVYFKHIHLNNERDLLKRLGLGFGKDYLEMLERAYEVIDYLDTIKNEIRWFYYRKLHDRGFSYLNLFRNGEKIRTTKNLKFYYRTLIPTQKQLESLLIPQFFKDRVELTNTFIKWKNEQNISQIRDALHYPYLITDFLQFLMFYKYRKCWNSQKLKWDSPPKVFIFKINEFLSLRLEKRKTNIYVNNEKFKQCKFLLFNISSKERKKYKDINSIDEASELYDKTHETNHASLNPETEFWGHCSNLQAWYENDYDTRILHSNLAFPLLRKLVDAGDPLAKKVFKEEIISRLESEYYAVFEYLASENYLDYFTKEELKIISRNISHPLLKIFLKHYFSFKQIDAYLKTISKKGIQKIFISSISPSPDLIIGVRSFEEPYSQENIVNFSDFRASLNDYAHVFYLSYNKKLLVVEKIVDLCCDIFSKNSKTVLIKPDFTNGFLEFFSITKKICISILLYKFNDLSGTVVRK